MTTLSINATTRDLLGSASSSRLREEGRVPAVVYGKGLTSENLSVNARDLRMLLRALGNTTPLVQLTVGDGKAVPTVMKEVQRHAMKDTYTHVDFQKLNADEVVSLEIPVHAVGEANGVANEGGTIETVSYSVLVRCLPANIPSSIDADVTALNIGESFHVSQLPVIEGVEYRDSPEQPVFAVVK